MQRPLEGTLVLDLSRVLAAPYCTQMSGDMGATVIKVEEPNRGDDSRGFAPPHLGDESCYFMAANRSKRSLALDLKRPEGIDVVKRLAKKADVVVENFRPGTADKMGLGYEALSKENPGLVYVSVSGFGHTGPDRERPGYDVLAQAMGGIMSLTGEPDGPPVKVGISQADLTAGLYAIIGTLLGLLARERNGKGQHVETCLLDTQVALLTFVAMGYFATGQEPRRMGNRHANITPYQPFEASDGRFIVAAANEPMWRGFCAAIERPEMAEDPRFATNGDRVQHREQLEAELAPVFASHTVDEWIAIFDKSGIPAGAIMTVPQVLEHKQVLAREMVVTAEHPTAGELKMLGNPIKLSATPAQTDMPPPLLGQHTEEILRVFLDMGDEEIARLIQDGVVRQHQPVEQTTSAV